MNSTTNSHGFADRARLDAQRFDAQRFDAELRQKCARFTGLRGADAAAWLAAGDRLAVNLRALGHRIARLRDARRADRLEADRFAYGL